MNTQQLELAIEVAETGSISKAAAKLFLSQPNASSNIKALERELGFTIFQRTNTGIALTERGELFLDHARIITHHSEFIHALKDRRPYSRFHLGVTSYSPTINAFQQLYQEYAHMPDVDFFCQNVDIHTGIHSVYRLELDLFTAILPARMEPSVQKTVQNQKLQMLEIKPIPLNINLSVSHPLAAAKQLDIRQLAEYPFVDYISSNLADAANQVIDESCLCYKYRIAVDDRDLRCRLVASSEAFSIGCKLPDYLLRQYGLASFPLGGKSLKLYAIIRQGEQNVEEIKRYLELLDQQLGDI